MGRLLEWRPFRLLKNRKHPHRCLGCGGETHYPDRDGWRWRWGPSGDGIGLGRGRWTEALCPDCQEPGALTMRAVVHALARVPHPDVDLPTPGPHCQVCGGWIDHQELALGSVLRAWCRSCGRDWYRFTGPHDGHLAAVSC